MFKSDIEKLIGHVDAGIYERALIITEQDIKANRINLNIKTHIEDFILILISAIKLLRRSDDEIRLHRT